MAVSGKIPPELAGLLRKMVAIPSEERPTLREVYSELLQLHAALRAQGHSASFLKTVWGIPSRGLATSECSAPATAAHLSVGKSPVMHVNLSPRKFASAEAVHPAVEQPSKAVVSGAVCSMLPHIAMQSVQHWSGLLHTLK